MQYQSETVENMLRNYFVLVESDIVEYSDMKLDLQNALERLKQENPITYETMMGVFAMGNSIQGQAEKNKITKMQVHRRLDRGLHFVTNVMNGVFA
jgi:hypothetical protein